VLPGTGSKTPFLLSKELLKHLGCVLDTENDVVSFKKLKQRIEYRWEEPRRATMLFQSLPEGTNGINTEDRLNLKKLVLLKAQLSFRSAMSRTALTMSPLARQLAESLEFDRTENGFMWTRRSWTNGAITCVHTNHRCQCQEEPSSTSGSMPG
jgi:hypothetical protein